MAGKKVTWLGDNVTKTLETQDGKKIKVGEDVTLTDAQVKALKATGHMFADPKSEEAGAARQQPPPTAPTGGTATT